MTRDLLPNFMALRAVENLNVIALRCGGSALEDHDVEEKRKAHQRGEEEHVFRIDDALREGIEMGDEAEIRQRIGDGDWQDALERVGEAAESEEEQDRAQPKAQHKT